jgi:chaperonin cofactor prefoldin
VSLCGNTCGAAIGDRHASAITRMLKRLQQSTKENKAVTSRRKPLKTELDECVNCEELTPNTTVKS